MTSKTDEEIAEQFARELSGGSGFVSRNTEVILSAITAAREETKASARQDTERLDWLDGLNEAAINLYDEPSHHWTMECCMSNAGSANDGTGKNIRGAIDAARCGLDEGEQKKKDLGVTEPHKAEEDQTQNALPCIPLPDGIVFRNGGTECDMLNGPCACGAWHHIEDLTFRLANQFSWPEIDAEEWATLVMGIPITPPSSPDPVSVQERSESDKPLGEKASRLL